MRSLQLLLLLGAAALPAGTAWGQAPELARIDSLLDRSRFTRARAALHQWTSRNDPGREPDDVAYGMLLQARMAGDADSALQAYLELALGQPSSRYAPEALLRLGQGYAALGQHERAAGYLERIQRDYPAYPGRPIAAAWLASSQRAIGRTVAACATVARGLAQIGSDSTARRLLLAEQRGCTGVAAAPTRPGGTVATAGEGQYTVQIAAFRKRADAVALTRRLQEGGLPARVVIMPGSSLFLVRAGRFRTSADATPLLRQVRGRVPAAVMAADAHREGGASR